MSKQSENRRLKAKAIVPAALAALSVCAAEPVWQLGRDAIDPAATTGKVALVDGAVRMDGTNCFTVPAAVLGDQNDYTIEFEVKRLPSDREDTDFLNFVSNTDEQAGTGLSFGITYYPPQWHGSSLAINGHRAIGQRAFKPGEAHTVTLVAENRQLMFFLDGLLLGMTDAVKPSAKPLTFGSISDKPILPYELRAIRLYNQPVFPAGYDPSVKMMRTYSGDQYSLLRADVVDASLPRILVIGDSISMGYRRYISEHYEGKAYVDYWVTPLMFRLTPEDVEGDDAKIKRAWKGVLANGPYDVVTWNHSTLHMWDPGKPERCSPDTYPACMQVNVDLVRALSPKTRFIWVRCTPIVKQAEGKPTLDSPENQRLVMFNRLTDELMAKAGIPEVDLYAICERNLDKVAHDGVHWQQDAYKLMAAALVKAIDANLAAGQKEGQ